MMLENLKVIDKMSISVSFLHFYYMTFCPIYKFYNSILHMRSDHLKKPVIEFKLLGLLFYNSFCKYLTRYL
jgi:hypothetical protein